MALENTNVVEPLTQSLLFGKLCSAETYYIIFFWFPCSCLSVISQFANAQISAVSFSVSTYIQWHKPATSFVTVVDNFNSCFDPVMFATAWSNAKWDQVRCQTCHCMICPSYVSLFSDIKFDMWTRKPCSGIRGVNSDMLNFFFHCVKYTEEMDTLATLLKNRNFGQSNRIWDQNNIWARLESIIIYFASVQLLNTAKWIEVDTLLWH